MPKFRVIRENHSGGSIGVGLNSDGQPIYVERRESMVEFCKEEDARRYMVMCERHMPTRMGQLGFKLSEIPDEKEKA